MSRLTEIRIERLSLPLVVPYKLAFGPVQAFDSVIVFIKDDEGRMGFGEATILTGYTPETIDGCWEAMGNLAHQCIGVTTEEAKASCINMHKPAPFTATAMASAIELLENADVFKTDEETPVPLLAILNAMDEKGIVEEINRHADAGYKTIKVKIGWEVESDLKRVAFIQSHLPEGVRIRIDGNQGYTKEDGIRFASTIDPHSIELLEQPCHMDDWDAAKAVGEASSVPYMLDESIYGEDEIKRAADLGCVQYIKLKLMKAGSAERLIKELQLIRDLGMTPVLGNGVAADPGCWMECCVARTMIDNAGEMNGFLKPVQSIFEQPMQVRNGNVILPPGRPEIIDTSEYSKDKLVLGAD